MKNDKVKKNTKKPVNKKKKKLNLSGIIVGIIAIVFVISGISKVPEINKNKDTISYLDKEIEREMERNKEVDKLIENSETDAYYEKVARDKLNMIRKDEIVFIDVTDEEDDDK